MADLLHAFGVEWHVLIVQIVNVAILVLVLQRFAFKPLLRAIDARREKIRADEERARELTERITAIETREAEIMHAARQESERLMKARIADGKKTAETLINEARQQAATIIAHGKQTLEHEKIVLLNDIKRDIGLLVATAIHKTVGDIHDEAAEKRLIEKTLTYIEKST